MLRTNSRAVLLRLIELSNESNRVRKERNNMDHCSNPLYAQAIVIRNIPHHKMHNDVLVKKYITMGET